jgi:uncharacterized protein
MTPELLEKLQTADNMTAVEDLYAPYKPKRRTRASIAREKGLQGLADMILLQARTPGDAEKMAQGFLNDQVTTVEDALAGARDIVAETISDHAEVRASTRRKAMQWGMLAAERIDDAKDEKAVTRCITSSTRAWISYVRTRCWPLTAVRPRRYCASK